MYHVRLVKLRRLPSSRMCICELTHWGSSSFTNRVWSIFLRSSCDLFAREEKYKLRLLKTKGKCCSGKMALSSQLLTTIPVGVKHYQTILARFQSLGEYNCYNCVFHAWISTCVLIFFVGKLRGWEYTYKSFSNIEKYPLVSLPWDVQAIYDACRRTTHAKPEIRPFFALLDITFGPFKTHVSKASMLGFLHPKTALVPSI